MSDRNSTDDAAPPHISLIDNTAPAASSTRSHSPESGSGTLSHIGSYVRNSDGVGRREVLRKAIAERRYKKWSADPYSAELEEAGDIEDAEHREDGGKATRPRKEAPSSRAVGVVVERDSDGGDSDGEEEGGRDGDRGRSRNGSMDGRCEGRSGSTVNGRNRKQEKLRNEQEQEISEIDVLYENQRGWFVCGIPLFSSKSLLNFDPAAWQNRHFHDSAVSIVNAQLPDPSWAWSWPSWYVDMTSDVDEEGWSYSFSFSPVFSWHGAHIWFNSFVRRRRWLRKRAKIPEPGSGEEGEGAAHHLMGDYFTIHSAHPTNNRTTEDENDGDDDNDIQNVPQLQRAVKRARVDREKIDVIMRFVASATEEVAYLPEHVPDLMGAMIFQASRRQLLSHLLAYTDAYAQGLSPKIVSLASRPGIDLVSPAPGSSPNASQPLLDGGQRTRTPSPAPSLPPPQSEILNSQTSEGRKRKLASLRKAVDKADGEVKRFEFWSDVKDVAVKGESVGAEGGWEDVDSTDSGGGEGEGERGARGARKGSGGVGAKGKAKTRGSVGMGLGLSGADPTVKVREGEGRGERARRERRERRQAEREERRRSKGKGKAV